MDGNQPGVQLIESEEDKKKKAQPTQPGSAFAPSGPAKVSPTATQQARAQQAAGPTRGTGFTGVGRFLQANVGSRLGQEVAGRVSQTGQEAASRLGQSVGQFQQQRAQQQQQLTQQQQAAQAALQRISSGELTTVTPEQQAAYATVAGGGIAGPAQLQDVEGIRSQAKLAGQLARGTQTASGRAGLLQQTVGRGPRQYTSGQSALDALLLGQAGGQLAAARRSSAGLERQVGAQERLAEEQARQFGAEVKKAKEEALSGASAVERPLTSELEQKLGEFTRSRGELSNQLQEALSKGELTKEQADILGISGPVQTYGLTGAEVSNLLKSAIGQQDVTAQAISTPEQAAKLNALYRLTGQKEFATPEQLAKAGTISDYKKGFALDQAALERKKEEAKQRMAYLSEDLESSMKAQYGPRYKEVFSGGDGFSPIRKDESGVYNYEDIQNRMREYNSRISELEPLLESGFTRKIAESLISVFESQKNALSNYAKEYSSFYSPQLKIKE